MIQLMQPKTAIGPLPHGQINLNGNMEYRRIPDGDGS